jgi:hypothetical protein
MNCCQGALNIFRHRLQALAAAARFGSETRSAGKQCWMFSRFLIIDNSIMLSEASSETVADNPNLPFYEMVQK